MTHQEYERFNALSEKILSQVASSDEQEEFNELMVLWNDSVEFNFINSIYTKKIVSEPPKAPSFDCSNELVGSIRYYD